MGIDAVQEYEILLANIKAKNEEPDKASVSQGHFTTTVSKKRLRTLSCQPQLHIGACGNAGAVTRDKGAGSRFVRGMTGFCDGLVCLGPVGYLFGTLLDVVRLTREGRESVQCSLPHRLDCLDCRSKDECR